MVSRPVRRVPASTYRLQLNGELPLAAARELVPYLDRLGVDALYSSPLTTARRGSLHGYDVVDPTRVDPALGGEEALAELAAELAAHGMGLVLDIVPNHMAATPENPWWRDLLVRGPESPWARFFDVDWESEAVGRGRLLVPVLGDVYGAELAAGNLRLVLGEDGLEVAYHEHRFPLSGDALRRFLAHGLPARRRRRGDRDPGVAAVTALLAAAGCDAAGRPQAHGEPGPGPEVLGRRLAALHRTDPAARALLDAELAAFAGDPAALDALLAAQPYRLAVWRLAPEAVNYRRFFDIADLAALRVEDEEVFAAVHALVARLVRDGVVTGLRVDHVDGLRDPAGYLERLQREVAGGAPLWVVVEKILAPDEELPEDWPVAGTTGYDTLNSLTGLFVEPSGLQALDRLYARYTGLTRDFEEVRTRRKRQVLDELFPGEVASLARRLQGLAAADPVARDVPYSELHRALVEVTAGLPVYRTYLGPGGPDARDRRFLGRAFAAARRRPGGGPLAPLALDFLERVLTLDAAAAGPGRAAVPAGWLDFARRWQQLTGPAMAKGLEDTALYVYNRLISLNAVGGEPEGIDPPGDVAAFHRRNARRQARWPHGMTAGSTHDGKRSEDVRARVNVLSELAEEWGRRVERWTAMNRARKRVVDGRLVPDSNAEIFLYQTLVGAWPLRDPDEAHFRRRLEDYLVKAAREAKVHTSWLTPDEAWEEALVAFTRDLLDPGPNPFLDELLGFVGRVAPYAAWSSLSQLVLRVAGPGVPDLYQGTELWRFSLVDPDNRRTVDWEERRRLLDQLARRAEGDLEALLAELLADWRDGRIKLWVTWRALTARRADPELFLGGAYLPLEPRGGGASHLVAFARRLGDRWAVAVAPRWLAGRVAAERPPVGEVWDGLELPLPAAAPERWRDALGGAEVRAAGGRLAVPAVLRRLPVALLLGPA